MTKKFTAKFIADYSCPSCGNGWSTNQDDEQEHAESCPFCGTEKVQPDRIFPSDLFDDTRKKTEKTPRPSDENCTKLAANVTGTVETKTIDGTEKTVITATGPTGNTIIIQISDNWGEVSLKIANDKHPDKEVMIESSDNGLHVSLPLSKTGASNEIPY